METINSTLSLPKEVGKGLNEINFIQLTEKEIETFLMFPFEMVRLFPLVKGLIKEHFLDAATD